MRVFSVIIGVALLIGTSLPGSTGATTSTTYYLAYAGNDNNDCLIPATACASTSSIGRGQAIPTNMPAVMTPGAGSHLAATVWTVTDTSDSATDTGSLRYAIDNAHNGDTITFDPFVFSAPQTIALSAKLAITANVAIVGPGPNLLTLDGADQYQVLSIPTGVEVTVSGVLIFRGNAPSGVGGAFGGGIYNAGTLTISNSSVGGNLAESTTDYAYVYGGGIYNTGTLTISSSTLSGNQAIGPSGDVGGGGGIYNTGTMTISNSTLNGNASNGLGGGIDNEGGLTIINSTISDNSAVLADGESGGGILNDSGGLTVINSTLSGNSAAEFGGGIYNRNGRCGGGVTVINSTISGNTAGETDGGGVYNRNPPMAVLPAQR